MEKRYFMLLLFSVLHRERTDARSVDLSLKGDDLTNCPSEDWLDLGLGNCYRIIARTLVNWYAAVEQCRIMAPNSQLARFNHKQEIDRLIPYLRNINANLWIGLAQKSSEGSFRWLGGQIPSFTNWDKGEPSHFTKEHCVESKARDMTWNDVTCSSLMGYICTVERDIKCRKDISPVRNALTRGVCKNAVIGKKCQFTCHFTYRLIGQREVTCTKDGWSSTSPVCAAITCIKDISTLTNGTTTGGCKEAIEGEYCSFLCQPGYKLVGEEELDCTSDGWSSDAPTCGAITCKDYVSATFRGTTMGVCKDALEGEKCHFICQINQRLTGIDEAICNNDGWSSAAPECIAITCKANISSLPRGSTSGSCNEAVEGEKCVFLCQPNHRLKGEEEAKCTASGWSTEVPVCVPIACAEDISSLENGTTTGSCRDAGEGETCSFLCDPEHRLRGEGMVTCTSNGWSAQLPTCVGVEYFCESNHPNTTSGVRSWNSFCKNQGDHRECRLNSTDNNPECACEEDFELNTDSPNSRINCIAIPWCPKIGKLGHSVMSGKCQDSIPLSMCFIKCRNGYKIDMGETMLQCQSDGTWDSAPPTCVSTVPSTDTENTDLHIHKLIEAETETKKK